MIDLPASDPAKDVVGVLVTYFPDADRLAARIAAIRKQLGRVVVVDNGSPIEVIRQIRPNCDDLVECIMLGENRGIAAAQNIGIDWARSSGASYVLLLDQDSDPEPCMVATLRRAANDMESQGMRPGLLAPVFIDERRSKLATFFRFDRLRMRRFGCGAGQRVVQTDAAIASGSLISLRALEKVGGMREDFFIDLVDIEWCLRARDRGFRLYGVCDAVLGHRLGEKPRSIAGRSVTHHSPLRNYYFFRNAVWLFRQGYVPAAWKIAVSGQLLRRYLVYPLLFPPRWEYLRMMSLGIWHGALGRLGPKKSD